MFKAIKKQGQQINAYRLGEKHHVLDQLIDLGKIRKINDDLYEVFSQEAIHGKGELTRRGDYIKIDSTGTPYPNTAAFFEQNHKHIAGNVYEQIPKQISAWTVEEPMCEEIDFLIKKKGLEMNEEEEESYFHALLWGTRLSASKNAVVVFYSIERDGNGCIVDADFNFVAEKEFYKMYTILDEMQDVREGKFDYDE